MGASEVSEFLTHPQSNERLQPQLRIRIRRSLRFCFSIGMCSNRTLPWLKNV
jgi:hypothetical protein